MCDCGNPKCANPGKHPITPRWQELDETPQPPPGWSISVCGQGIPTGAVNDCFVLDVDTKGGKDGFATLRGLGELPDTLTVETGSGGRHLYFKHPGFEIKNSAGLLGPGLDIRGDKGYVVHPGSPWVCRETGRRSTYRVVDDNHGVLAEAPTWLLSWLRAQPQRRQTSTPKSAPRPIPVIPEVSRRRPEGRELADNIASARKYLATVPPCVEGGDAAGTLGSTQAMKVAKHLIKDLRLTVLQAGALWEEIYDPRCEPPWGADGPQGFVRKLEEAENGPYDYAPLRGTFMQDKVDARSFVTPATLEGPSPLRRRERDPLHKYSVTEGDAVQPDPSKISSGDIVWALLNKKEWRGVLWWNLLTHKVHAVNPPIKLDAETDRGLTEEDVTRIDLWFQCAMGRTPSHDVLWKTIPMVAHALEHHPIRDYLESLPSVTWDPILPRLAKEVFGAEGDRASDVLQKTLIAAVRRVLDVGPVDGSPTGPGCQVDTVLTLISQRQGKRKTSALRALFHPWYQSNMPSLEKGADASQAVGGVWCVELGEMAAVRKVNAQTRKEFISRTEDRYRPPYGRVVITQPRACIFIATGNEEEMLDDETGNRRFWPIVVEGVTTNAGVTVADKFITKYKDRIWAEALERARTQERHWYTFDEEQVYAEEKERFVIQEPVHDPINKWMAGRTRLGTTREVWLGAIAGGDVSKLDRFNHAAANEVARVLRRLGADYVQERVGGRKERAWYPPPGYSDVAKSAEEQVKDEIARLKRS